MSETISTTSHVAAAEARLADLLRIFAGDRAAAAEAVRRHRDVIAVSSGKPVPADPPPAVPGAVNTHPGPDFAWDAEDEAAA